MKKKNRNIRLNPLNSEELVRLNKKIEETKPEGKLTESDIIEVKKYVTKLNQLFRGEI